MNKAVVYIDIEDDITAIIGKIKASKGKIVVLVPPKRIGVFQSTVNMRLIAKSAKAAGKQVVIITNDSVLGGLAASAKIPIAKNLQSKPEIAAVPVLQFDSSDDIIDGSSLPVGDMPVVESESSLKKDKAVSSAIASVAVTDTAPSPGGGRKSTAKSSKVPNFNGFRKKLAIFGTLGLLLIGFLIWAVWIAPRATITVSAKTTTLGISERLSLKTDTATNIDTKVLRALRQEQKSELSVDFTATGKRNVGNKSRGSVKVSTGYYGNHGLVIPAGTELSSSSGKVFLTDKSATFSLESWTGVTIPVTAKEVGISSNGATGSVSGLPSQVSGSFVDATTGGTDKEVTAVSQSDVDKAKEALSAKKTDELKAKLTSAFGSSASAISDSYQEQRSDPVSSLSVGDEATGPVSLKSTVTATMLAVDLADLDQFLTSWAKREISDKKSQKIYSNGAKGVKLAQFRDNSGSPSIQLSAEAVIGPTIDELAVKNQAKGKRYGDIQSSLKSIEGVDSVDTQFSPFWVRTVPSDISRITVKFNINDGKS